MSDVPSIDAPRPDTWRAQTTVRDASVSQFIEDFVAALEEDRLDDADELGRAIAMAEVMTRGLDLHEAIADRRHGGEDLVDPARPGLLLVLAVARMEAAGDITALERGLRAAAKALVAAAAPTPTARARNLSLAAMAVILVGDDNRAFDIAERASDLILGMHPNPSAPDFAQLTAAASDLAVVFVFVFAEHYNDAARMWRWARSHIADPRVPALMQADWGLAIVGVISGERTLVSPLARAVLQSTTDLTGQESTPDIPHHLWWALVQTARAWTALDDYRADDALTITRHAVASVMLPTRIAPLSSVHAVALIAEGRPAAALEHLERQHDHPEIDGTPSRWRRAVITLIAASLSGADVEDRLNAPALASDPNLHAIMRGWVGLLQGRSELLDDVLRERDGEVSPRASALDAVVRAAARHRRGNSAEALRALQRIASLQESRNGVGWALLLPDADVQSLRPLAVAAGRPQLASALPERTAVIATTPPVLLTERERDVLRLLQQGWTNAQIATLLFISPNTVKFHVANILRRLGVANRDEAAALGIVATDR